MITRVVYIEEKEAHIRFFSECDVRMKKWVQKHADTVIGLSQQEVEKITKHDIDNLMGGIDTRFCIGGYHGSYSIIDSVKVHQKYYHLLESNIYGDEAAMLIIDDECNIICETFDYWIDDLREHLEF